MFRIDVHVLRCHEPKEWIEQCLKSLSSEPVNVFLCDGVPGNLGLSRARAFEKGSAEYVSYVDGDDYILPGAFDSAIEVLDARPEVVSTYTDLTVADPQGQPVRNVVKGPWTPMRQLHSLTEVHHLHVMRRSAVMQSLDVLCQWPALDNWVLMAELCRYGIHYHIAEKRYVFRNHDAYVRASKLITASLRRSAAKKYVHFFMDLHERGIKQDEPTTNIAR